MQMNFVHKHPQHENYLRIQRAILSSDRTRMQKNLCLTFKIFDMSEIYIWCLNEI